MNSFKSIKDSIEFETKRQIEELENGGVIYQETRRFDDAKGIGYAMRTKEDANDYRYFPEPDLAPIVLSDEYIENIKNNLPELPHIRKERYVKEYKLPEYDAQILTSSKIQLISLKKQQRYVIIQKQFLTGLWLILLKS